MHPLVYMDNEVFENFYYVPPEDFVRKNKLPLLRKRLQNLKVYMGQTAVLVLVMARLCCFSAL